MALSPLRDNDPARIGQFRLSARLGAGGMGVVYLGTAKDGTPAAIKLLRPELADDDSFRIRFRREVSTLGRVNGLCTIRVIEADTESDRPYLATEYVEGPTLAEQVSEAGPLDGVLLPGLATGLAEALTAIHAAGIVHRDLKPSNVLLTGAGPRVIDFGIAQALDSTAVTRTGMAVGSPGFMAPEQLVGEARQPADVFAWGVTVAFAATGRPPFGSGPAEAVMYRIRHEAPDTSGVPEPLRALVEQALSKSPGDRPPAPAVLAALAGATGQQNMPADTFTDAVLTRTWRPSAQAVLRPGSLARSDGFRPARRRRSRLAILAAAVIVLAAAAGTIAALDRTHPDGTAGATSTRTHAPRHSPVRTPSTSPTSSTSPSPTASPDPVSPSVSGPAPQPTASPSTAPAGTVSSGSLTCGFQAQDGGATVYVSAQHVASCQQVSENLASSGAYWNPVAASTITQDQDNGTLTDSDSVCHLSNPAGALMSVYEVTSSGAATSSALGSRVCQSEEQKGWTPHASTQS